MSLVPGETERGCVWTAKKMENTKRKQEKKGGKEDGRKEGNAKKEENAYLGLNPSPFDLRQAQYRSHDMRRNAMCFLR